MIRYFLLLLIACPCCLLAQPAQKHYLKFKKEGDLQRFLHYDENRIPMISAHRGGRNIKGYPENAIATFDYVLSQTPAIIEFDVSMTADSVLILMHDKTIDRTTNGSGPVLAQNWEDMKDLRLKDDFGTLTTFKIPLFAEVLQWAKDKTVLTVDVKRGVPYEKVIALIEEYEMEEYAAVITYNANAAQKVHQLNPNLMISVGIRSQEDLDRLVEYGVPTKNMIAFTGTRESDPAVYQLLHEKGILCILGTLGNLDKSAAAKGDHIYPKFVEKGADILATDRPLEASKAIENTIDYNSPKMKFFKSKK